MLKDGACDLSNQLLREISYNILPSLLSLNIQVKVDLLPSLIVDLCRSPSGTNEPFLTNRYFFLLLLWMEQRNISS